MDHRILDTERLNEFFGDDTSELGRILGILKQFCGSELVLLREELDREEYENLRRRAHAMKSALGNFGATEAYRAAMELEHAPPAVAAECLAALDREVKRFEREADLFVASSTDRE